MIWVISVIIVLIFAMYKCIKWIYDQYKDEIYNIDEQIININKEIGDLRYSIKIQKQLINYLYDEIEGGKKNGKRKDTSKIH